MADIAFPTAKVVFRAAAIAQDSDDSGSIPQEILLGGIRVTLIPALKYVEVAAPPGGVNPTTYSLRTWNLITTNDGNLINMDDPEEEVLIVASDAFPGYVVSWKSVIEDPSETLPPIIKKWLAPAGSIVDLTTVVSVPNNPNPIADYLQAVYDAREARDNAISASEAASLSATAAANARNEAEVAAGQATAPTDEMVAGLVSTSSATKVALSSTIGTRIAAYPLEGFLDGASMPADGVMDASAAIQAGLDAMQALADADPSGDRVYVLDIPAGTFRLANALVRNMHSGAGIHRIGVRGAGKEQTILAPAGGASCFSFHGGYRGENPRARNCYFGHFTIDMAAATHPDPTGASYKAFVGGGFWDCEWEHLIVRNSPATAIGVDYPVRCRFTDVHVHTTGSGADLSADALGEIVPSYPVTVAKAVSGFGFGFGMRADESVTFVDCTAVNCHRAGFFFECYGADLGYDTQEAVITMIGCVSERNNAGVVAVGAAGVVASSCRFDDNQIVGYYSGVTSNTDPVVERDDTLQGCSIRRNGVGVYSTGDISVRTNYSVLYDVLGGYRILDCRIEDNIGSGIHAERYGTISAGGLVIRGNSIRRNGGAGVYLGPCQTPIRDLIVAQNYFDGNSGAGVVILGPLTAPSIIDNTFVNLGRGGIVLHPAEPVSTPMIQRNTFRYTPTPLSYVSRLDQALISGNRYLGDDSPVASRLYHQIWYGATGSAFPVAGDGWAKNTSGSIVDWYDDNSGIAGSGTNSSSYIYRDVGTSGVYAEVAITKVTTVDITQAIGVILAMASASDRTCIIAGVNAVSTSPWRNSDHYAVWTVVANGVPTLLWESDIPRGEGHRIALARAASATMTHVFIDGELVHSVDIPTIAPSPLVGMFNKSVHSQGRRISEFRAIDFG